MLVAGDPAVVAEQGFVVIAHLLDGAVTGCIECKQSVTGRGPVTAAELAAYASQLPKSLSLLTLIISHPLVLGPRVRIELVLLLLECRKCLGELAGVPAVAVLVLVIGALVLADLP